ncbi:MAG: site-specific integrase [Chloroflexi bacterium]|uniref:site-specific integrase n=1 Tax=Candidatus Flexifilum breve TaxID=3140694 RepID=UPI003135090B|nr:site-specific integrase [Chloroflexota bacterium]
MAEPTFREQIKLNPCTLSRPKAPKPYQSEKTKALTDEQARALLRVVKIEADLGDLKAKRDYAMLRFFFATGKRREEIVRLQWGDVRMQRDGIVITAKHKGGIYSASEVRDVGARTALVEYLKASGRWNESENTPQLDEDEPLWLRHDNAAKGRAAVTSHGFAKAIKRYAERVGIADFHLHQTRHTVARMVGEESGSLAEVQTVLGHQNQATTRVYLQRVAVKRDRYSESIAARLEEDDA